MGMKCYPGPKSIVFFNNIINSQDLVQVANFLEKIEENDCGHYPYVYYMKQVIDKGEIDQRSLFYSQESWNQWNPNGFIKKQAYQSVALSLINEKLALVKEVNETFRYLHAYRNIALLFDLNVSQGRLALFHEAVYFQKYDHIKEMVNKDDFLPCYIPIRVLKTVMSGTLEGTFFSSQKEFNNWQVYDGMDKKAFLDIALKLIDEDLKLGRDFEEFVQLQSVYQKLLSLKVRY